MGLLCGVVGFRIGWRSRNRVVLPLFQTLLGGFAFFASWRASGAISAAVAETGWALGTTLVSIAHFRREPRFVDAMVPRARPYRAAMFAWLRSGRGPESHPLATLGQHARELALYVAVALLTANLLALAMGAMLLNYMNAYVARLLDAARDPWTVRLLGWNCWSLFRVAAYIVLGSACTAPLAARAGYPALDGEVRTLLWLGGAGVLLDLLLKLALSRPLGRRLAGALDPVALESAAAAAAEHVEPGAAPEPPHALEEP